MEVSIDSLGQDGCGYSVDGKQGVFGALPGEQAIADPISKRQGVLYLRASDVKQPSSDRVAPLCTAAAFCGGCSYQHLAHDAQLQHKQAFLQAQLMPLAPSNWLEPLQAEPYAYRSKARLGVKLVYKKGRVLVGFREKMKPYIAETASCPVLVAPVNDLITPLAELVSSMSEPEVFPQIELASGDDEISLIFRHLKPLLPDDELKLRRFGERHEIQIYLQPGGVDSTHRIWPDESGEALLTYSLEDFGLNFQFSPQDFTQVNLAINRKMVALAVDLLALEEADRVFDAFCGIGNFALAVARRAASVVGAESADASVNRARENARRNDVSNAHFEVLDLHENDINISQLGRFNKVLLDPPRSGAEALVKVLASSDVSRVVYVSCNPSTLARDIKILVESGFKLQSAGIIDMFPHTTHVESVALLVRGTSEEQVSR